jgi:hypothetical protein
MADAGPFSSEASDQITLANTAAEHALLGGKVVAVDSGE